MDWDIERTDDVEAFDSAVRDYLMRDEAIHNVTLGLIETLQSDRNPYAGDNLMAFAHAGDRIGGVLMRTPPYPGLLSLVADETAAARLIDTLVEVYPAIEGLNVPKAAASRALDRLESLGFGWEIGMRQRLYRTSTVDAPEGVPGTWRLAEADDAERVGDWFVRFEMEVNDATEQEARDKTREQVEARVAGGLVYVWTVDDEPVSMAGYAGHTPNGARVGFVYTPPAHRGNGYASAITAVATRRALEAGCTYCYLFTDLDNPTTNRIYPAIGYAPVADQHYYALDPSSSSD